MTCRWHATVLEGIKGSRRQPLRCLGGQGLDGALGWGRRAFLEVPEELSLLNGEGGLQEGEPWEGEPWELGQ